MESVTGGDIYFDMDFPSYTMSEETFSECNVCGCSCINATTCTPHQIYDSLESKLLCALDLNEYYTHDIFAEVNTNWGGTAETIVLQERKLEIVKLNLLNYSNSAYEIVKLDFPNPVIYACPLQSSTPQSILANSSFSLDIEVLAPESLCVIYPVVFRLRCETSGFEFEVIKKLIIHFHSENPNLEETYERTLYANFPPDKDYDIPRTVKSLVKANFKEHQEMTRDQNDLLQTIKQSFMNYKEACGLTEYNYFVILKTLLYCEEYYLENSLSQYIIHSVTLTYLTNDETETKVVLNVPNYIETSVSNGDVVVATDERKFVYYGQVCRVQLNEILLQFYDEFYEEHCNEKRYTISFSVNRYSWKAKHHAVNLMLQHNAISWLFNENIAITAPLQYESFRWFNPDVASNEMQKTAVLHIVSKTSYPMPYIVFGPPGTGKTVTLIEAILQIWSSSSDRILVCSPSNSVANEITRKLTRYVSNVDMHRLISPSFPSDLIPVEILPYTNCKDGVYYQLPKQKLKRFTIIITTLINASKIVNEEFLPQHFSYVIIDESGQATESDTLMPIAGILTSDAFYGEISGQIVLAGDPKQLGPIVQSHTADEYGFGISMLERLMCTNSLYQKGTDGNYNCSFITKLVECHRSHPAIINISNSLFYNNELRAVGNADIIYSALGWKEMPNPHFPIIFHSVFGQDKQEEDSTSYFNTMEVIVIQHYLKSLLEKGLNGVQVKLEDIGIISPYKKQCSKIRAAIRNSFHVNVDVGSVEAFQGQEKLIIIISTVRSRSKQNNVKWQLGFLKNPKRLNVAITRAKALLIIVGNPLLLQFDPHWGALIEYCRFNYAIRTTHHI